MHEKKFDPNKLHKLNNPQRLVDIPPELLWDRLKLDQPDTLVDVGAGTGMFSVAFSSRLEYGRIFACDTSEVMIQWMNEQIVPSHPRIVPLITTENAIPLADGLADLVFMINLHHELEAPELLLREAWRILRADGKILIADWKKADMPEGPPARIRCRPEQVNDQLLAAGFEEVRRFDELVKHFLIIARKPRPSASETSR